MKLIFFRCDITISSIYQMYQWEEILINDVKEPQCTCSKQNFPPMLVFEMRKLCLWPSKNTLTKKKPKHKKQRRFLRNFFNIRMTNKSMRVDETYVNPGQYLQFSQLLQSLPELITCTSFVFVFECRKNYEGTKFTSRIVCRFTELNQLIFRYIKRKKGFRLSELFFVHIKFIHLAGNMSRQKRMSCPHLRYIYDFFTTTVQ